MCATVQQLSLVKYYKKKKKNEEIDTVKFYTDSKVVLGYIHNQTRRFVYIENRANHILRSTKPEQWNDVPTSVNPTDRPTPSKANDFSCNDIWLKESEIFLSSRDLV